MSTDIGKVVQQSEILVIAVPSAYADQCLSLLTRKDFENKKVVSAIKGLLPEKKDLEKLDHVEKFTDP